MFQNKLMKMNSAIRLNLDQSFCLKSTQRHKKYRNEILSSEFKSSDNQAMYKIIEFINYMKYRYN